MHPTVSIDPEAFIAGVQPLLESRDLAGLLSLLKTRWTYEQIRALLKSRHVDAKKVALLSLGLVAPSCCIPELAQQLKDPDRVINEIAEHSLWLVWFRGGSPAANHELHRGAQAIERRDFEHAIKHFDRAIEMSPEFAEAHNQKALALYLMENYEPSIEHCRRAVELMPCHFGALAGLGHCYAHLDQAEEAITYYQRALDVNPHMDCVREAIEALGK